MIPNIEVIGARGEYRLVHMGQVLGGQDYYGGSDVLCLGDEILEQLPNADEIVARDSVGYVFADAFQARAARGRLVDEIVRFRRGK